MLLALRRHTLRIAPHTGWLAAGVALTLLSNAALLVAPPLACRAARRAGARERH